MLNLSKETEQLVRLVAVKKGTTPEDVVRKAVEDHARTAGVVYPAKGDARSSEGPRVRRSRAELVAGMEEISRRSVARPLLDPRSTDEIIDYDDFGLPR